MLRKSFLTILVSVFLSATYAQELLSLDQAIELSLKQNFGIKVASTRKKIGENDNTLGNAGFLPTVTGQASKNYSISKIDQEFFGGVRDPLRQSGVKNNNGNLGVNVVWTLFDGMGMFIARDRLAELQRQGVVSEKIVIENTIAQVANAYYDILRQSQRLKTFKDALEISNERLRLAKDRYEVGQGSKLDYLAAQVDYNGDKAALVAQEQALRNARIALNALLVRDLNADFSVPDTIILNKNLQLETLRPLVLSQNPSLVLAGMNKKLADLEIKNQKSLQLPQLDFLGGYNYNTVNNGAGFGVQTGKTGLFNYGVRATVNIFDGYNQKRRIENAKVNSLVAEYQEKDLKVQLESALERTYLSYRNSLELVQLELQNFAVARQNVDIAFERYKIGVSTPLELREAQRNAVAAQTRLIEAEFNTKLTEIELQRLSSTILMEK
ncbi:MAG: TolC family protein [Spirosomataceae bacterium]